MNLLDFYYRAFKVYRAETENNRSCVRDRNIFSRHDLEFDHFKVTKYLCTINSDWIEAIEKGLEFVEKAVQEERQFIRVNGEVVPIEKAKKVSKYSVEHLAKHSNMITHIPEDEDAPIIPDSIYMVEKLSDYAVYENRFLYMLLCYLRDFIALRLEKIQRLRMTYICDFELKKTLDSKSRQLNYETKFHEERFDNPFPIPDELPQALLKRIEDCQQIILMLLNTNLMNEVSKAAMLKPPIIKTNVLKMNNNFKNALALYDYIVTYKGEGYTAEPIEKEFAPFSNLLADELAELATLTAFLTYKNGNEIDDFLNIEYLAEEERRKQQEALKLVEQIKKLKKRVAESGMGMEEYVLLVEKRNRMLEDDSKELKVAKKHIEELNQKIDELNQEIVELNRRIEELKEEIEAKIAEIAYLNQKYIDDMAALKRQHEIEKATLISEYENKIQLIKEEHEQAIIDLCEKHDQEIFELEETHKIDLMNLEERLVIEHQNEVKEYMNQIESLNNELQELKERYDEAVNNYSNQVNELKTELANCKKERDELLNNYEAKISNLMNSYEVTISENDKEFTRIKNELLAKFAKEKKELQDQIVEKQKTIVLREAEINTYRIEKGVLVPCEEMAQRERFEELEKQYLVFNEFFKRQWEITKKEIRKQILWTNTKEDKQLRKDIKMKKKAK